jgi:hypothetical protein
MLLFLEVPAILGPEIDKAITLLMLPRRYDDEIRLPVDLPQHYSSCDGNINVHPR